MNNVKPMGFLESLIVFAIPALIFAYTFYELQPWLLTTGMNQYYAYILSFSIPLLLMGISAVIAFSFEGGTTSMMKRFNFKPITSRQWVIIVIVFTIQIVVFILLNIVNQQLILQNIIPLPQNIPDIAHPKLINGLQLIDEAVGGLKGNWSVLIFTGIALLINVVGEELWWRGYVFPRQALAFGSKVWIIHGLLWALFHSYKYWDMLILLPVSLGLSYAVYKTNNSSTGLVFHTLTNGTTLIAILFAILI